MSPDYDDVLATIGPRLRTTRQEHELTLAELAERTGISLSTLSRLESGQRKATLELLLPLARTYGVAIEDLIGSVGTEDPRVSLRPVRRDGMVMVPLSRRPGGIQAYKMVISRHRPPPVDELRVHEGFDWLYVLSGRLRLLLGERDLVLAEGEAAEFDTRVPHWFGSADGVPVEVLSLFGTQGERAHLRARTRPES